MLNKAVFSRSFCLILGCRDRVGLWNGDVDFRTAREGSLPCHIGSHRFVMMETAKPAFRRVRRARLKKPKGRDMKIVAIGGTG